MVGECFADLPRTLRHSFVTHLLGNDRKAASTGVMGTWLSEVEFRQWSLLHSRHPRMLRSYSHDV